MTLSVQTYNYGAKFAAVTAVTMAAYSAFTIVTTSWRTKFRKQMNAADNKGATVAVDSLINYEAVKVGPRGRIVVHPLADMPLNSTSTTRNSRLDVTTPP